MAGVVSSPDRSEKTWSRGLITPGAEPTLEPEITLLSLSGTGGSAAPFGVLLSLWRAIPSWVWGLGEGFCSLQFCCIPLAQTCTLAPSWRGASSGKATEGYCRHYSKTATVGILSKPAQVSHPQHLTPSCGQTQGQWNGEDREESKFLLGASHKEKG